MRALAFLLVALSGCSFVFGSGEPGRLSDARDQWADAAIEDYSMTLSRSCFCGPDHLGPFQVEVENGVVVFATRDGEAVPLDRVLTVEDLFDLLEEAYDTDAERVDVEYDAAFGFPTSLYIDQSRGIADEEIGYTVTDLRAD